LGFSTPVALSRFTPYAQLVGRSTIVIPSPAQAPSRPEAPQAPPCPYPVTAAQRAYADANFAAAVRASYFQGTQWQYINSIYVPALSPATLQLQNATYQAQVSWPRLRTLSPSPYLGQWIVGASSSANGGPRWLTFPVDPNNDPYGSLNVGHAMYWWQQFSALATGQPYAATGVPNGKGTPVNTQCGTWSH
jgi:hypothetical protein